ncbi:27633_t:CDS:1, partial [Racocetra persica]
RDYIVVLIVLEYELQFFGETSSTDMCNWCCKKKNECFCSEYNKEKPPPENSYINVEESDDEYNE